jgi:hypothetical protein
MSVHGRPETPAEWAAAGLFTVIWAAAVTVGLTAVLVRRTAGVVARHEPGRAGHGSPRCLP